MSQIFGKWPHDISQLTSKNDLFSRSTVGLSRGVAREVFVQVNLYYFEEYVQKQRPQVRKGNQNGKSYFQN